MQNGNMHRRHFIIAGTGAALLAHLPAQADTAPKILKATALTEIFGDGVRLTGVLVQHDHAVTKASVSASDYRVTGRTVTGAFACDAVGNPVERGEFVMIQLSPDDADLSLKEMKAMSNGTTTGKGGAHWKAGDKPHDNLVFRTPQATVSTGDVSVTTSEVRNRIADSFQQHVFEDAESGRSLRYNLFVPENVGQTPLPLVLFMHDAGVTSEFPTATLLQGLGGVIWAAPEEQARRPCFVLAPQYDEIIVDDNSRASAMLEITIRLLRSLQKQYRIDERRLYATGQSGGCMMAMAMNIKYPDLFAASYLVAGKWDASLFAPLVAKPLWFMASVDDKGAFPSMNAITEQLEQGGARVARAWWDATWTDSEYRYAADDLLAERRPILYTAYRKGTVFMPGESQAGASGHRNTWKYAYSIEPVREWLFAQTRS